MSSKVLSVAGWFAGILAIVAAILGAFLTGSAFGRHHQPSESWVGLVILLISFISAVALLIIYRVDKLGKAIDRRERGREQDHEAVVNLIGDQLHQVRGDVERVLSPLRGHLSAFAEAIEATKTGEAHRAAGISTLHGPRREGDS